MDQEQQPRKQPAGARLQKRLGIDLNKWTVGDRRLAHLGIGIGLSIVIITVCGYVFGWEWTGLTKPKQRTFWDWLDLLVVPVVLALGGYLFNRYERRRTTEDAEQQRDADRQIADQRAQDDALQAYLDHIGLLLLDKDRPLRQSKEGDDVRTLARARTLTELRRVDGERRGRILEFLNESGLIAKEQTVVDLTWANLSEANLIGANLSEANLRMIDLREGILHQADLRGAALSGADMEKADLTSADLTGAELENANLKGALLLGTDLSEALVKDANLEDANLTFAKLIGSHLESAILSGADLTSADLSNAILSNEVWLVDAKLRSTNLANANLNGAFMNAADLSNANLRGADLRNVLLIQGANLSRADLTNANLNGAMGVSNKELDEQAASLEGATMPTGQKYEDWLKDKDGGGEDGKYSGSS